MILLDRQHLPVLVFKLLAALSLCLSVHGADGNISLSNIYLNSPSFCSHSKSFDVSPTKGYLIMPDINPRSKTTSFRECEVTFHSVRVNGRVCVSQEGMIGEFRDSNAELDLYDGESDQTTKIFTIRYFPGNWNRREYCTHSPFLYVHMRQLDKQKRTDVTKLHLLLKIQDIQSLGRTVYFEEKYCTRPYALEESQLNIVNRLPYTSTVTYRPIPHLCSVQLKRKKDESRRICYVYIPGKDFNCNNDWNVRLYNNSMPSKDYLLHTLSCKDSEAREMHVWCTSNMTNLLTMLMHRPGGDFPSNSTKEPPGMFRFIVADYSGLAKSFLERVQQHVQQMEASNGGGLKWYWIAAILVGALVLLVIVGFIIMKLKSKYTQVPNHGSGEYKL